MDSSAIASGASPRPTRDDRTEHDSDAVTYSYALNADGPSVPSEGLEMPESDAIDVTILWGDSVLHAVHLAPLRSFYIGEAANKHDSIDFAIPATKLGLSRLPLVLHSAVATAVSIPQHATGTVTLKDGSSFELTTIRAQSTPSLSCVGACEWSLPMGAHLELQLADLVFHVRAGAAAKRLPHSFTSDGDATSAAYLGLSFVSVGGLLAAAAFFVPPLGLTNGETIDRDQAILMQQYLDAAAEREREPEPATAATDNAPASGSGSRAQSDEGALGRAVTPPAAIRYAVKGPPDNPDPHLARQAALHDAADFGMVGLLGANSADPNAPTASWGREASLGQDAESALGNMWGDTIGEAAGVGGLGVTGLSDGGGGPHQGIGVGPLGTLNHGAGTGPGNDFGNSHGRGKATHITHGPKLRVGVSSISGRLPKEVIQRVVRLNFGRFRLCYERSLAQNPNLEGRVNVQFVIDRSGAVASASNGGSSLPDANTVNCVVRAFYGLTFPKPESGVVTVGYPILFAPE